MESGSQMHMSNQFRFCLDNIFALRILIDDALAGNIGVNHGQDILKNLLH